jgi:hypothetical protein
MKVYSFIFYFLFLLETVSVAYILGWPSRRIYISGLSPVVGTADNWASVGGIEK